MEGEGEVKGDKGENTQKRAHVSHNMHVLNRPAARVSRSGFSSLFYAQNIPNRNCCPVLPSFCAGSFPFPGRTLLLLPPGYEKAVQTQPVSSGLPLGAVSDLYPLGFFFSFPFFFSSFGLFFIYLQLDACSSIDYFTKDMRGFVSAVLGALYRDLLSHTRPGRVHVVASRPQGRTHLKPAVRLLMNFACHFTTTDGYMTVNSLPAPPLVIGLHWWWLTKVHRSSLFYS